MPGAISVAVEPFNVHIAAVVEAKLTANPELAVAANDTEVPAVWFAIALKVIVWLIGPCGPDCPHPAIKRTAIRNPKYPRRPFIAASIHDITVQNLSIPNRYE
jgi:hypothetical protein